jgi:hypothetical protein
MLKGKGLNRNRVTPLVGPPFVVPYHVVWKLYGWALDDTNNATAESSSAQGRVKVEPFSQTIPLITAREPGKGLLSNAYGSWA